MVFNNTISLFIVFGIIIWLVVLTVLVLRATTHYNILTRGVTTKTMREVMDAILQTIGRVRKTTDALRVSVERLENDEQYHVQRLGLVRFNPFADTGGAQSFSIAFLDKHKSGLVMTSLYARSGNRWYIKQVVNGKGKELVLSKEEEEAVKNATLLGK